MIDRKARDKFAELFHQFLAGRLENFEFEDKVPESNDPAIYEIWWCAAWPLYDDFKAHRMTGKWRIPHECRRELSKRILFLKSDHEYIWPKETGYKALGVSFLSLLTLGIYKKFYMWKHARDFDKDAWPFAYKNDLKKAITNPVYLNCKK